MSDDESAQVTFEHVPGRFRVVRDGSEVGRLDYLERPGVWDMVHTWVEPPLRGTGLSSRLVTCAMDAARTAGVRVIPTCPYLPNWLSRHPDYADLVQA